MDITIGRRGSGKTTMLIRRSAKENVYILTTNRKRADYIFSMARKMGLHIPYPVTIREYMQGGFKGSSIRRDGLLIDDADDVLQEIFFGIRIKEITITDCNETGNCIRCL